MALSLSAKGLTHGEISAHLAEVYGAEISKPTITDSVMGGTTDGQNRSMDSVHPVHRRLGGKYPAIVRLWEDVPGGVRVSPITACRRG